MKNSFLTLCVAILLPLTATAYNYVDSLTFYAYKGAEKPILDIYGDTVSLNTDYFAVNADSAEFVVHVGYSGDTIIAAYLYKQDTTVISKLERFLTTAQGRLYKAGLHEYYRNKQLFCTEKYSNGVLSASSWFDSEGHLLRRFKLVAKQEKVGVEYVPDKMKDSKRVQQRIDMYPGTSKIKKMETYDKEHIDTHFYTLQRENLPFTKPSFMGGNEQLSKLLSKEFLLPEMFVMNSFAYRVRGVVKADGTMQLQSLKQKSSIKSYFKNTDEHRSAETSRPADILMAKISNFLQTVALQNKWIPGTVQGKPADMTLEFVLHYSPIFYASESDTLYCQIKEERISSASNTESLVNDEMFVHHDHCLPYYAVVGHNEDTIVLHYYSAAEHKPVLVERYTANAPDSLIKTGQQEFLMDNGARVCHIYADGELKSAMQFDSTGLRVAEYSFYQKSNNWLKLKTKTAYWPDAKVKQRCEFAEFSTTEDKIIYYDAEGRQAKFIASKDVKKVLQDLFAKSFKLPPANDKLVRNISYIEPTIEVTACIDETGKITDIRFSRTWNWHYNYNSFINKSQIDAIISKYYNPYTNNFLTDFAQSIRSRQTQCKPATINGIPIESTAKVQLTKNFVPEYSAKTEPHTAAVKNDNIAQTTKDSVPDEEDEKIYVVVEQMPQFPGGQQALFKYLSENVKYPAIAKENRIQGRVICQFVVNKDGSITDVEVVRSGGDPSLDREAVRVIKSMPNWIPGRQKGKPIRVKYSVPVNFRLN